MLSPLILLMLTFEKIRDLERQERETKDLAKLPDKFLEDVAEYLERKKGSDDRETKNIENTLKRLFEHRERKLLELVLYSAKTGQNVDNISSYEKECFDSLLSLFRDHRNKISSVFSSTITKKEIKAPEPETRNEYYRVKRTLKTFVGPDLKNYTLKENDVIEKESIPKNLRDLLLEEGVLEKFSE